IAVPVVLPSNVPDRILTRSASRRCVVNLLVPGLRASRNGWIAASLIGSPGGHPSTTAPSAGPWLSPQVVKRKTRPKVFTLMGGASVAPGRICPHSCSAVRCGSSDIKPFSYFVPICHGSGMSLAIPSIAPQVADARAVDGCSPSEEGASPSGHRQVRQHGGNFISVPAGKLNRIGRWMRPTVLWPHADRLGSNDP